MSGDGEQLGKGARAAQQRLARATSEGVDAQNATEFDMRSGLAGAEAKPFSNGAGQVPASPEAADQPEGDGRDLISGRRNAGREDGANDKRPG